MKLKKWSSYEKITVRFWRWIILLTFVIWYRFVICIEEYRDRKGCLCSILTRENQTLKIDNRLESICSIEDMSSGTFSIISLQCEHEYWLWLKIDKDAGTYQGRIVNGEVTDGMSDESVENTFSFVCI